MINGTGQIRSYHTSWSSHIKHKKSFIKLTNDLWCGHSRSYHNNLPSHIKHRRITVKSTYELWYGPKQILSQQVITAHQPQKDYSQSFKGKNCVWKKIKTGDNIPATIIEI